MFTPNEDLRGRLEKLTEGEQGLKYGYGQRANVRLSDVLEDLTASTSTSASTSESSNKEKEQTRSRTYTYPQILSNPNKSSSPYSYDDTWCIDPRGTRGTLTLFLTPETYQTLGLRVTDGLREVKRQDVKQKQKAKQMKCKCSYQLNSMF